MVKCRERSYWDSLVVWEINRSILAKQILTQTLKMKENEYEIYLEDGLRSRGSCQYWLAFDTNRAGPSTMSCDAIIRLTTSPSTSSCFSIFYFILIVGIHSGGPREDTSRFVHLFQATGSTTLH